MRIFYFFTPVIISCLIGCSTTYTVTNYPSVAKFHEDINSSIEDREVNIVTVDSSFTSIAGSKIKEDSLQIVSKIQEQIPMKEVKNINHIQYYGNAEGPSASIWLKSGGELRVENVKILPDSTMQFTNITNKNIPIEMIKNINYKNGWPSALAGIPIGLVSGALVGGILGSAGIIQITDGGMTDTYDKGQSIMVGAFSGALIGIVTGAVVGYIIGWDHIYLFNQ